MGGRRSRSCHLSTALVDNPRLVLLLVHYWWLSSLSVFDWLPRPFGEQDCHDSGWGRKQSIAALRRHACIARRFAIPSPLRCSKRQFVCWFTTSSINNCLHFDRSFIFCATPINQLQRLEGDLCWVPAGIVTIDWKSPAPVSTGSTVTGAGQIDKDGSIDTTFVSYMVYNVTDIEAVKAELKA